MLIYQANRAVRRLGRWGFTLPPTPTAGPIRLDGGGTGLPYAKMDHPYCPFVPCQGCWTDGISDCLVGAVAYYQNDRWERLWFCHIQGGCWDRLFDPLKHSFKHIPVDINRVFAVAAGRDWTGAKALADELVGFGIPTNNVSLYQSNSEFAFGVRLWGGPYPGAFGEVRNDGSAAELPA